MLFLDSLVDEHTKSDFLKNDTLNCNSKSKFYSAIWSKVDSIIQDSTKLELFLAYREEQINDLYRQDVVDYMIFDYHNYLTARKTMKEDGLKFIQRCNENYQKEIALEREIEYEIIRKNINDFAVGDTVLMIVPFYSGEGNKKIIYNKSYPFTLNYQSLGDSLVIESIITNKIDCESITNEEEAYAATFEMKIINEEEYHNLGPTFKLPLKAYGRPFVKP